MVIDELTTNQQVNTEIGQRVRQIRVAYPLTQAQLAKRAGVSIGTIQGLENGKGATLTSLSNILRALGMLARLDMLVPSLEMRPSEIASQEKRRQRVRASHKQSVSYAGATQSTNAAQSLNDSSSWKWGDEQ